MKIAVLYNDDATLAHGQAKDALAVQGVAEEAEAVAQACRELGHEPTPVRTEGSPAALLAALERTRPDLVFNLCESIAGQARLEAAVAWLLEWSGLPYTGSGPVAMTLALEKPLAKAVLSAHGVPVARGCVLVRGDEPVADTAQPGGQSTGQPTGSPLRPPLIVKPSREDASHGIGTDSVVQTEAAARERARWVIEHYHQPALVEEFAGGREFNVALLGEGEQAQVLPLGEIDFTAFPKDRPPLVSYDAKWVPDSVEYKATPSVAAKSMSPALEVAVHTTALAAYRALGLRDYGRVDMRLRPDTSGDETAASLVVLEVNPNPDISPDAGLARAAGRAHLTYAELIGRVLEAARGRC